MVVDWIRRPRNRSLAGLGLALVLAALMLGVLACVPALPAPVGVPERARIDDRISGAWRTVDNDSIWVLRPWDRRTWLLFDYMYSLEQPDEDEPASTRSEEAAEAEPDPTEELAAPTEEPVTRPELDELLTWEARGQDLGMYKVWLTRLGGVDFLTFETVETLDADAGFLPPAWLVYRVQVEGDEMRLRAVNAEFEGFDDWDDADFNTRETRARIEAVIARNANNPELYGESVSFTRIPADRYDEVAAFISGAYRIHATRD